jgi:hypothetical protein
MVDYNPKIGAVALTRFDDAYILDRATISRLGLTDSYSCEYISGEDVRDWCITPQFQAIWPYESDGASLSNFASVQRVLWPFRSQLLERVAFGKTQAERGLPWHEYSMLFQKRFNASIAISFSNVATHNHFAVVGGKRIFNAHAPLIILERDQSFEEYASLAGALNSSIACLWMKQTFHNKGSTVDSKGARQRTDAFEDFYEFTGTGLVDFPLPKQLPRAQAKRLVKLAEDWATTLPEKVILDSGDIKGRLDAARTSNTLLQGKMIAQQEELDWACYYLYGLTEELLTFDDPPEVKLGQRAFEIHMARRASAGVESSTWFSRHGSIPICEIPDHWPNDYKEVIEKRLSLLEIDSEIGQLERPEFKRRWNSPKWEDLEEKTLRNWLLTRLETHALWSTSSDRPPQIITAARLAEAVQRDADFMQVAARFAGHADFDLARTIADLVAVESVPFLPVMCYSDTGLRKREQWENTWALQRREDEIDADVVTTEGPGWRAELTADARTRFGLPESVSLTAEAQDWVELKVASEIKRYQVERKANEVGPIPVPPKYQSKDFLKTDLWRLRGGLDVPKERWVSYPGCERGADTSLPIAWAGWDHLQQATALAAYYLEMKESEGWEAARLQPLLAGLLELLPWLEQWHNEVDPVYGERMGAYYKGFVSEEARSHGFTLDDLRAWKPAAGPVRRGRRRAT